MENIKNKEWLITGGSGSLGQELTRQITAKYKPKGIRVFSRNEFQQWKMKQKFQDAPIAYILGDVRDTTSLTLAAKNVDFLIHAAALKHVPFCEENPLEAIKTNVLGSQNVLMAALENKIEKVMLISTDKAVKPINLYGSTKMCAEKIFINGNIFSGGRKPFLACSRYGNVLGSRGSVVPLFKKQGKDGLLTITHPKMTRFWITIKNAADFILKNISVMEGAEIFIPFMKSSTIEQIADVIAPGIQKKYIGIREGEKLHETLISIEEGLKTFKDEIQKKYIIKTGYKNEDALFLNSAFCEKMTDEDIKKMLN